MPETSRGIHYASQDLRPPWAASGAPVLFHHGIGTTMDVWAGWVPVIAARHPVLRLDMRGFGRSPVPPPGHVWSMAELVADLWSVADDAGHDRVHLVGESFGGTIALAGAIAQPHRVASVTILNASYTGQGIGELPRWRAQFDEGVAAWSRRMMDNRFAPGAGEPRALRWFEQVQAQTHAHVALGLGEVLARIDLGPALAELDVPISIVLPDASPFVPVERGVELHRLARNARLRVVPGVRHGLPFSHAAQEAAHLLAYLDEVRR